MNTTMQLIEGKLNLHCGLYTTYIKVVVELYSFQISSFLGSGYNHGHVDKNEDTRWLVDKNYWLSTKICSPSIVVEL